MLNRFHLWWPVGIVTGAFIGMIFMDLLGLSWHFMVASLFIPLLIYGYLFYGQNFPETELSKLGISQKQSLKNLITPLYIFVATCMLLSATTELGTTQRIESLLRDTGVNALLVLAFINGVMIIGRALAGEISKNISTCGMLLFSSIFSFAGLQLLSSSSGMFIFLSAGIFAIGITFFWPTTLAYISENIPESGAFGLSLIGGLGMFSVSLVLPLMGQLLDNTSGNDVIKTMSILPFTLIFLYGFLFIKRG